VTSKQAENTYRKCYRC